MLYLGKSKKIFTMQPQKFSVSKMLKAFYFAFNGVGKFISTERNAAVHFFATIVVVIAGIFFRVSTMEAVALTIAIALVWITELLNTCIEKTMDFISLEQHPQIKHIKDIAAGAVLIASVASAVIGLLIFIPKIL